MKELQPLSLIANKKVIFNIRMYISMDMGVTQQKEAGNMV